MANIYTITKRRKIRNDIIHAVVTLGSMVLCFLPAVVALFGNYPSINWIFIILTCLIVGLGLLKRIQTASLRWHKEQKVFKICSISKVYEKNVPCAFAINVRPSFANRTKHIIPAHIKSIYALFLYTNLEYYRQTAYFSPLDVYNYEQLMKNIRPS